MVNAKSVIIKKHLVIIIAKLKNKLYLIIPLFSILFYALIALYKDNFTLIPAADFPTYYYCSKLILTNPEKIYFFEIQPFPYTPFFAILFIPMGFLTFEQAHVFFFSVILILSLICIILFDQIVILKNITKKSHRLLFLIAISNGIIYVQMFDTLGARILTTFGLLWFLKREIKIRVLNKEVTKSKFIFSQMMILIFMFGVTLQYVFLVLLYLFYNVKFKDILSNVQVKKYFFLILSFLIQNFMLIVIYFISPEAILNFIGGSYRGNRTIAGSRITYDYILEKRPRDPTDGISITLVVINQYYSLAGIYINILLLSVIIMSIITLFIHLKKELKIENKFGLWALCSLFFYTFTHERYFVGLLPMITILFLDYPLKSDKYIINFLKANYLQILGLFCIIILYFVPPIHYLIRIFPLLVNIPIAFLYLKYIYIYISLVIILLFLKKKQKKNDCSMK